MNTNLSILRAKFATEIHFTGTITTTWYPAAGIQVVGMALMHLDALLLTSDGGPQGSAFLFNCIGYTNNFPVSLAPASPFAHSGLAAVNFKSGSGFNFDTGACIGWEGGDPNNTNACNPFIAIGCANGIALTNGGFITTQGSAILLGNDSSGMYLWPRSGTQWDGPIYSNANAGQGIQCYLCSTGYLAGYITNGAYTSASHVYRNAGYGPWLEMTNVTANMDFGAGGNANQGGTIYAGNNSGVQLWGNYANYTPGCSPAFGTNGNNNSMINIGW
jgi:hypothetical protein